MIWAGRQPCPYSKCNGLKTQNRGHTRKFCHVPPKVELSVRGPKKSYEPVSRLEFDLPIRPSWRYLILIPPIFTARTGFPQVCSHIRCVCIIIEFNSAGGGLWVLTSARRPYESMAPDVRVLNREFHFLLVQSPPQNPHFVWHLTVTYEELTFGIVERSD